MRYQATDEKDEDKATQALQKLAEEDLTLRVVNDSECRQTLLYGLSEQHLKAVADRLNARYKVSITLSEPKVAYRETIRGTADVEYKHKKQSGGHGQYGHVKIKLKPSGDYTTPYIFEESVVAELCRRISSRQWRRVSLKALPVDRCRLSGCGYQG